MSWPTTTVVGADDLDERPPGRAGERLVDLVGDGAADVVRLEDGVEVRGVEGVGHAAEPSGGGGQSDVRTRRWPRLVGLAAGLLRRGDPQRRDRAAGLADGVGEREQVVARRALGGRVAREPQHLPAAGRREPLAVLRRTGRRRAARRRSPAGRGRRSGRRRRRSTWRPRRGRRRCANSGGQDSRRRRYLRTTTAPIRLAAWMTRVRRAGRVGARIRDRRGRGMRGPAVAPARARAARAAAPAASASTTSCSASSPRSTSAGRTGSAWWSTPSRTPRRSPTTGPRAPCRCRRWCAAPAATPTRLVLFRRPIEHRCETRTDLEAMVLTIVVEQVAELLGIDAEEVDPRYERRAT